ncbi:hypothetical protein TWF696_005471 [Orbilia brochopaga]|uniref:Protein kinase domain-containing protein n=1 Tax=Orbilia brochopaga TaxID=3140254 RepID=A0AAV9V198_9PEZI
MDLFGTAVTAIHEIYTITVFIREVVQEIKNYDESIAQIQAKFDIEYAFLVEFKRLFFDDDDKLRQYQYLSPHLLRAIDAVVVELNKGLADYRLFIKGHGLDISDLEADSAAAAVAELAIQKSEDVDAASVQAPTGKRAKLQGFWDNMKKEVGEKKRQLKWALFNKEKIEALVDQYEIWSGKLRRVMKLVLLVEGRVGSQTQADLANNHTKPALGLGKAAARQIRAQDSEPSTDFTPVEGEFEPGPGRQDASASYQIGTYIDELGESIPAISEQHAFDIFEDDTDEYTKQRIRLQMIRSLAWMLTVDNASRDEGPGETSTDLLQCIGYVEDNGNKYPALLYRLPASEPNLGKQTLYDYINPATVPSLGDRFHVAWSLASTVFNIHTSGWVHKNIQSRGILISSANQASGKRPTPYLVGWTAARPRTRQLGLVSLAAGQLRMQMEKKQSQPPAVPLESQLYMHGDRYGGTTRGYECKHDIYSLGVVLLEIGLWEPMGKIFEDGCKLAKRKGKLPPYAAVLQKLIQKSEDSDLARAMGREYGRIVRRCLKTEFEVDQDQEDDKHTLLISQFQTLVVDRLQAGSLL